MNLHNNKYLYLSLLLALSSCGGGSSSPPSPVITLTASSEFVLVDSSVTIIWSSSNTSNCKAYGAWSGSKATTGNQEIIITSPGANIFNISCSGSNGSRSASVTVEGYRETTGASVDGYIRQADIFIDTMKNRNVQIILESHSEHLLRRLQRRVAEEQLTNQDTALYFCQTNNRGISEITALKLDRYGNINNWPDGFFGDELGELAAMTEAGMRRQIQERGS